MSKWFAESGSLADCTSTRAARIYLHTTSERGVQVAAALNRFLPTAHAAGPPANDPSGRTADATGT